MSTQTTSEFDLFFGLHDLLPNQPLVSRIYQHLHATPIEWSDDEQQFARACQREMDLPEAGMMETLLPIIPEITTGGGTDVGDVSFNTPTALFAWATMPAGVGLHTWPVTACGGMTIGDKGAINSAIVMTGVGYDVMTDADFRKEVRAYFDQRVAGRPYVSPLPPEKLRPEGIPAHLLLRDGSGELVEEFYELADGEGK
jgi:aminobenzoyl-glutamate utilization protein B